MSHQPAKIETRIIEPSRYTCDGCKMTLETKLVPHGWWTLTNTRPPWEERGYHAHSLACFETVAAMILANPQAEETKADAETELPELDKKLKGLGYDGLEKR